MPPEKETFRDAFAEALLDPEIGEPESLSGPGGKTAVKRFNVYRNNVTHSLMEALGATFPGVRSLCGPERFSYVATLYVRANPPKSRLVFEYGDSFADFLDDFEPAREQFPWLSDVARLERAWLNAYHAADAPVIANDAFTAFAPDDLENLTFKPHPAFFVLRSHYAVHDLFEAGRAGTETVAAPHQPQDVMISRPQLAVEVRLLPSGAAVFFSALANGSTLGEAAAEALAEADDFDISAAMTALLVAGCFERISPPAANGNTNSE